MQHSQGLQYSIRQQTVIKIGNKNLNKKKLERQKVKKEKGKKKAVYNLDKTQHASFQGNPLYEVTKRHLSNS